MITNGPFSLTNNVLVTVADPMNLSGTSSAKVQVQNASAFLVNVSAGGQVITLQEFTAQTIALTGDGTPITILPTNGPAGSQGELVVVWMLDYETPPMQDGQLTGAAQYAVGLGEQLASFAGVTLGSPQTVQLPPTVRTLLVYVNGPNIGVVTVVGNVTGFTYYNQPPYLGVVGFDVVVVPVSGLLDSSVNVAVNTGTGPWTIRVFGDTAGYTESNFYVGQAQTTSVAAAGTVITGPARLLTAELYSAAGNANMLNNGIEFLRANGGGSPAIESLTFPPNTIIPRGVLVTAAGGVTVASMTWAYP